MTVASPCTGICKLDQNTGWCLGCGRSGDDIAAWNGQSSAWRDGVWAQIPTRLSTLGVRCRRLPWTTDELRQFVLDTLQPGRGTWVMGVVGAVAEYAVPSGWQHEVRCDGDTISACTRNGALRMSVNDDVRALTFDPPAAGDASRIVLAVKRERGHPPVADSVCNLGVDRDALEANAAGHLFDLGLGRAASRFCVRVCEGGALTALQGALGQPFSRALPHIGAALVAESPPRVVESALGRIEAHGRIPPPDARSPLGPHTHLLPDHLATERDTPIGMDLPGSYLPGAIFYPPR
ncbi:MAG: DUF1289 domain-containing protein [Pseudomonadota bacterium]